MNTLKEVTKKTRGRPSSFDREKLIDEVMNLFWERGYKDLSFNEIAQATGLTRASLYNAFEDKETLFLEALHYYFSRCPDAKLNEIQEGESVGSAFYELFNTACQERASDKKHRGCMAINCLSELMNENSELGETLKAMYEERRILVVNLIRVAVSQHELPADTAPEATGNMILAFLSGFSIFSKNGMDEIQLKAMCHNFLRQVGFKNCTQ